MAAVTVTADDFKTPAVEEVPTVRPWTGHSVWFKLAWADEWTWIPYCYATRARESASPAVGTATIVYDFGNIKQYDRALFESYTPIMVQGAYVMILAHDVWGDWPAWFGVVQTENAVPDGSTTLQGTQTFTAFELSHLLDRSVINDAYTEIGWIDRAVPFNKVDGHGLVNQGNRSAAMDANDTYYFAGNFTATPEKWTAMNVADYILQHYSRDGIRYLLSGDAADSLDDIIESWDFAGSSPKRALDELIDRRRGLGWRIMAFPEASSDVYVYVFSTLAYPLQYADVELRANEHQAILEHEGLIDVQPDFTYSELNRFDTLVVQGELVRVCGTFSYADSTLEKAWTDTEETAYRTALGRSADNDANDKARQADKYDTVYQKHRVPKLWNGALKNGENGGTAFNALPSCTWDGYIDVEIADQQPVWMPDKRFNQELPFLETTGVADSAPDYRRAFAIIKNPDDNTYQYVDKITGTDLQPAHLHVSDRELAIYVRPQANHMYALNHFLGTDPGSDHDPVFDYETLIATLFFETDARLQVTLEIPGNEWSETGRTKTIRVPDAHCWVVCPNTVTDVQDGALVRTSSTEYTYARVDNERLRTIAALAAAWYGTARATCDCTFQYITPSWFVGTMMLGAVGQWYAMDVGTVVTDKEYDFENGTTRIATGFEELEFRNTKKSDFK